MESAFVTWTPDQAVQTTLLSRQSDDPDTERRELMDALDIIERKIILLWRKLDHHVERREEESIRRLIEQIREDKQILLSLCIAHVDHDEPELDILHDLTNNDLTLNLHEELAIAATFGCLN